MSISATTCIWAFSPFVSSSATELTTTPTGPYSLHGSGWVDGDTFCSNCLFFGLYFVPFRMGWRMVCATASRFTATFGPSSREPGPWPPRDALPESVGDACRPRPNAIKFDNLAFKEALTTVSLSASRVASSSVPTNTTYLHHPYGGLFVRSVIGPM